MSQFNSEKYWQFHGLSGQRELDKDTPCASCGYNLKGLKYGAVCPECGTPMLVPRRGGEFVHAPDSYLLRMSRGLMCLMLAWACLFGVMVVGFWFQVTPSGRLALLATGTVLAVLGCHLLDCRRPNEARATKIWLDASRLAFISSLVYAGLELICAMAAWQAVASGGGSPMLATIAVICGVVSIFALIGTQACVTMWLRNVSMEAQDTRLSEAFGHQWWGFVILGGLMCLSAVIFTWLRATQGGSMPVLCLGCYFPSLFVLLLEVWWVWTVLRLKRVCTWAIRYQAFDAGRADRDRERGERI
ncbi:MAG: hypothetical protein D8M59_09865 [Planctomycetes bacterium]|nr:hypothetical protein [Planctomycetota bacterium]NOG53436.1 hypothetical protein [Planctomycetota bacterium]